MVFRMHDVTDLVRLELSEEDRLVPTEVLERARSSGGALSLGCPRIYLDQSVTNPT